MGEGERRIAALPIRRGIIEPMIPVASYLLYGIEALPVALEVRPGEPGDVPQRVLRAIAGSGYRLPGSYRISVRETGQDGPGP